MNVYPLKFKPIYKYRLWGGRKLESYFGKELSPDEKIGESWELADLPKDKSEIINGPLAGQTLAGAIERLDAEITGKDDYEPPFPLLIKILDANDILSVQVHPDPETCERMGKGDPKTECWYIIDAEPGAYIYKGLKRGTTKEHFAKATENGTVADLLAKVEVHRGECHFLPAGTCHAIGPGLLIAEIQTPSDTTYRVFDWNRVEPNGKPRQLHVAEALESIHFDPSGDDLSVKTVGRLLDSRFFKIDKGHRNKGSQVLFSPGQLKTLIILTGAGGIVALGREPVEFKAGDTLLVPAAYEGVMKLAADTEYLTVTI